MANEDNRDSIEQLCMAASPLEEAMKELNLLYNGYSKI